MSMKRGLGVLFLFGLVAIFSIALISASFLDNFLGKITGNPISNPQKGDINSDGFIDKIDLDILVDVAFRGGSFPEGSCLECADINEDGVTDILDVTMMTNYVYRGGTFSTNSLTYICGDTNGDSILDQTDLDAITSYAFGGVEIPTGAKVDLNGDGVVDILDVNIMTDHVKRNGPKPTCTSGATNVTCTDSDGGKNYFVKGYVYSNVGPQAPESGWDDCLDDNYQSNLVVGSNGVIIKPSTGTKLSETFCNNDNMYETVIVDCSYGCYDGACISSNQTNQTIDQPPIIDYLIGSSSLVVGEEGVWSYQATDPENQDLYYGFEFGDGKTANSNPEKSGTQRRVMFAYSSPGTYSITFKVREASRTDIRTTKSMQVKVVSPQAGNQPPKIASPLTGQNVVAIGVSNSWSIMARDPNNDSLDYWFYWEDGTRSHVSAGSGISAIAKHTYNKLGDYIIYASVSDLKSGGDVASILVKVSSSVSGQITGLCGDADLNGEINEEDITKLSDYAFGGAEIPSEAKVDLNADGVIDILDVTILTNYVKRRGPKPTCEKELVKVYSGTSWLHNSYNESMTCQELCGSYDSEVVANGCYDRNLEKCSVAQGTICTPGEFDYEVSKDYATACCCKGNDFGGCASTDGVNPFIKGKTTSKEGVVYEDKCDGVKVIDYFCDAWGQVTNINDVVCLDGCVDGACKKVEVTPNPETGPIELPDSVYDKEGVSYDCSGCVEDKKCYPFGYRKAGDYCSDNFEFTSQLEENFVCENNFECNSNVCISGECVSQGLIKKILDWFGRLFGG